MTWQNKTNQKIISFLVIVLMIVPIILFSEPKQANAVAPCLPTTLNPAFVPVTNPLVEGTNASTCASTQVNTLTTVKAWAQKLLELFLQKAAQQALQKITQSIVVWINSGFHGSPLFLENSDSFFQDIAKSEVKNLVTEFGYNPAMFPWGKDWALNAISSYQSQLSTNAAYTMAGVMTPDQVGNFAVGGWNGFLVNTQYPQNNYLGFNMMMTEEIARELQGTTQTAAQKVQTQLQQGNGFLSPETCADNNGNNAYNSVVANAFQRPSFSYNVPYNPPIQGPDESNVDFQAAENAYNTQYTAGEATAKATWAQTNTCKNLIATTPGSVVASQITKALGAPQDRATLAGALGNDLTSSVGAIIDALLNKLVSSGLDTLSGTNNSQSPADNWSYNGQTLGGGNTGSSALNVPSSVSIQMGDSTTNPSITTISGGTAPYNIPTTSGPDLKIATTSITGTTLKVTGVSTGTTSFIVVDSSSPVRQVTVEVTVVGNGDLMVVPANIVVANIGDSVSATISGGSGNYTITIGPNQNVAQAAVGGNTLIVTGIASGITSVTIQDSSSPTPKTAMVNITVAGDLTANPSSISSLAVNTSNTVTISGGMTPYSISTTSPVTPDPSIATASLSSDDSTLTVAGKAVGTTSVTIQDSSLPTPKTTTINITVTGPIGNCVLHGVSIGGMTQSACTAAGGTSWVQNP